MGISEVMGDPLAPGTHLEPIENLELGGRTGQLVYNLYALW